MMPSEELQGENKIPAQPVLTDIYERPKEETDPQKLLEKYHAKYCGPIRAFLRAHWKGLSLLAAPFVLIGGMYVYFVAEQEYKDYRLPIDRAAAEAKLGGIRLTLADADGSNLPPVPDKSLNDSTVEGVDVNANYIRDDVEHALFALYPESVTIDDEGNLKDENLKKRAAALQYAQAVQIPLVLVSSEQEMYFNSKQQSAATFCLWEDMEDPEFEELDYIDDLVVNTEVRKLYKRKIVDMYARGGSSGEKPYCHISI